MASSCTSTQQQKDKLTRTGTNTVVGLSQADLSVQRGLSLGALGERRWGSWPFTCRAGGKLGRLGKLGAWMGESTVMAPVWSDPAARFAGPLSLPTTRSRQHEHSGIAGGSSVGYRDMCRPRPMACQGIREATARRRLSLCLLSASVCHVCPAHDPANSPLQPTGPVGSPEHREYLYMTGGPKRSRQLLIGCRKVLQRPERPQSRQGRAGRAGRA
ncbi:hypothetical protein F4780DRAFT_620494 [Xylariomycetidae sp. FL0641]|nr:hypothetical protein F4780DRAFT_620494 [Xylariomycetidae sp. FL0641]